MIFKTKAMDPMPERLDITLTDWIKQGELLRVRANGAHAMMNFHINRIEIDGETQELTQRYSKKDAGLNWTWYCTTLSMCTFRVSKDFPAGSGLTIFREIPEDPAPVRDAYGYVDNYSDTLYGMSVIRPENHESIVRGGQDVSETAEIRFEPGEPARIEAYLKPDGRLLVQYFDASSNPTPSNRVFTVSGGAEGKYRAVGISSAVINGANLSRRSEIRDENGFAAVSNAPPITMDGRNIYFGEIHWHTSFSVDGLGDMAVSLMRARTELGLDFAGTGDHIFLTGDYKDAMHTVKKQGEIHKSAEAPGEFVTLAGGELSGVYGHINFLCRNFEIYDKLTRQLPGRICNIFYENDRLPLSELADICPGGDAFMIPHHTNIDSYMCEGVVREDDGRPYFSAMHWPLPAVEKVRLAEMCQMRGSFESEEWQDGWKMMSFGLGGSIQTGLMRGYKMGFTGGTDNHQGWPTRAGEGFVGVTAVIADTLTSDDIYEGLYNRRCYATTGERIIADATLNGYPIGSEIYLSPLEKRNFTVKICGTAPITDVEIIHQGFVLHKFSVPENTMDFYGEYTDDRPGRPLRGIYYYVRARQSDGGCAWLSPFFVEHISDAPDK